MKLDYTLSTLEDRLEYVNAAVDAYGDSLSNSELSRAADYLLWADPAATGCILPTKWDRNPRISPLDTLENSLAPTTAYAAVRQAPISRSKIRETGDPLVSTFEELWARIDALAAIPNPTLAQRHELLELRNSQYPLYDVLFPTYIPQSLTPIIPEDPPQFGADITVLPCGLYSPEWESAVPALSPGDPSTSLDFENVDHLAAFIRTYRTLDDTPTFRPVLLTLEYYMAAAHLTPAQRDLLSMRLQGLPNSTISQTLNSIYSTSYSSNYISTIYYSKILPRLAAAATDQRLAADPTTPRKTCKDCRRQLPLMPAYFIRSKKSRDGFSCRCKQCTKTSKN